MAHRTQKVQTIEGILAGMKERLRDVEHTVLAQLKQAAEHANKVQQASAVGGGAAEEQANGVEPE